MLSKKLTLLLMIGTIVPFIASADEVIFDNLIVTGISDGTAPAYDCSAGATLPFFPFDSSSVTETIPAGDPVISEPEPDIATCDFLTEPFMCEYTCETDIASAICVGFDCINDESFTEGETIKLKENNLRIRFDISTIDPAQLGRSWNINANSSRNNGASYFGFDVKSLEADTVYLVTAADGVVPSYDCSLSAKVFPFPAALFDDIKDGIIAVGEPLVRPQFKDPPTCIGSFPDQLCEVECVEELVFNEKSLLTLGPGTDPILGDGVAVGYESSTQSGVVSVGRTDLVRRIAHVAAGIGANDALTLADLGLLEQQLINASTQLDVIEAGIIVHEVLSEIDIILNDPSVPDKAKKNLNKSKKSLDTALEELVKGDVEKAFKEINKAIEKLLKAEEEGADVLNLIDQLVEALQVAEA
jgi:hypothetical protein